MEIAFDGVIRKKSVGVVRHWRRFVETEFCTFTCRFLVPLAIIRFC